MRRYTVATLIIAVILLQLLLVMIARPAQATGTDSPQLITTFEPYGPENPLPRVVLIEYDPWNMVLGADSPTFVLYENGQVIYRRENADGEWEYASVFLNIEKRDALFETIVSPEFYALDDYYEASEWTDQPNNWIWVWNKGKMKRVGVYGQLRFDDEESRQATPEAFLQAFDTMVNFDSDRAETWLPKKFEVMLWPYETSDAADWPATWPDLDDPTTKQRGNDSYSIYVDIAELEKYRELREEYDAVELDGLTWAFALRYPFPTEFEWMEE